MLMSSWIKPHRIILLLLATGLVAVILTTMHWDWLPQYGAELLAGVWVTIFILVSTVILGFLFAVPLGLFQVTGPRPLALICKGFCTLVRGTPLLLQLWLIYYGVGSLFPQIPWIRSSFFWPYLREAWPYGVLALTLSFAGYEGEVMRGAFAGVPHGELEAGRAYGMKKSTLLWRIWLPRASEKRPAHPQWRSGAAVEINPAGGYHHGHRCVRRHVQDPPGDFRGLRADAVSGADLSVPDRHPGRHLPALRKQDTDPKSLNPIIFFAA